MIFLIFLIIWLFISYYLGVIFFIPSYLLVVVEPLIFGAFLILLERHFLASVHRRLGPSIVGGLLSIIQPISDAVKLFSKNMGFNNGMPRITTYSALYAYIGLTILINSIFIMDIIYFCINTLLNNNYMLFIILLSIIETLFFVISKLIKSKLAYLSASRLILIFISFEIILLVIFCILTKFLNNFLYSSIICCILYNNTCILYSCPILLLLFLVILMIATKKWPFEIIESEHEISTGIFAEISSISYGLFVISEYLILIV